MTTTSLDRQHVRRARALARYLSLHLDGYTLLTEEQLTDLEMLALRRYRYFHGHQVSDAEALQSLVRLYGWPLD